MTKLECSAKKETYSMILTILLYGIGAASVPYLWVANIFGGAKEVEWVFAFILKTACAIMPVYLIIQFGFSNMLKLNGRKIKASIFTIPALLIMLNNLPFVPIIMGDMSINGTFLKYSTYFLYCLSIGVLEETVYRGCVLPLCAYKCKRDKTGLFWAIVISSALFGIMHLFNLFGGFSPAVFLQVGYSFLIGLVCGFTLVVSENIYLPILFHAIFDVGGFLLEEGLAVGILWSLENVLWTLFSSIVLGALIIIVFLKKDFSRLFDEWNLNRIEKLDREHK